MSIRSINPAVAVLTLLTLGHAQTRLALLSLTRKVRVQKEEEHLVDVPQYICPLASCAPLVLRRAEFGVRRNPVCRDSSNVLYHVRVLKGLKNLITNKGSGFIANHGASIITNETCAGVYRRLCRSEE